MISAGRLASGGIFCGWDDLLGLGVFVARGKRVRVHRFHILVGLVQSLEHVATTPEHLATTPEHLHL